MTIPRLPKVAFIGTGGTIASLAALPRVEIALSLTRSAEPREIGRIFASY